MHVLLFLFAGMLSDACSFAVPLYGYGTRRCLTLGYCSLGCIEYIVVYTPVIGSLQIHSIPGYVHLLIY